MGSGEKIQLPALWTPSLPILPPFPQLSSLLPPIFLPFLLPALGIPGRKGKQMEPFRASDPFLHSSGWLSALSWLCLFYCGPQVCGRCPAAPWCPKLAAEAGMGAGVQTFTQAVRRRK